MVWRQEARRIMRVRGNISSVSRLFFLIAFLTLSIGGGAVAKDKCEKLTFMPDPVDFGTVNVGASTTVTLTVTNPSTNVSAIDIAAVAGAAAPFAIQSSTCSGPL